MNREAAEKVLDETLKSNGGTFRRDGSSVEQKMGYVVAVNVGTFRTVALDEPELAVEAIREAANGIQYGYVGTWVSGNAIHIDKVVIMQDFLAAMETGRFYQQAAIYDLKAGREIYV